MDLAKPFRIERKKKKKRKKIKNKEKEKQGFSSRVHILNREIFMNTLK